MELGLKGRSVLVTGASRGIGRAIAESFAREGARLILVARDGAELERLSQQLARAHGVEVAIVPMDLSVRGATRQVAEAHPHIDVLINNAGAIPRGDLLQVDDERWRAGWELKVFGYIDMTRQYFRRMQERRAGCIVNIIGIGAEKFDYEYTAGSTGNAALVAFTRSVGSVSLDYGVRVFGVSPGTVNTDRTVRSLRFTAEALLGDAERWQELIAERPGGRLITPGEIADVVVFLSSDRGSAVSGHVMTVDAGFAARSYPHGRFQQP
jgi:NAD(P)-dependent dehydrogenase (short-subunit alcohol dehydrogenase family)